jgi:hypothetical protein
MLGISKKELFLEAGENLIIQLKAEFERSVRCTTLVLQEFQDFFQDLGKTHSSS